MKPVWVTGRIPPEITNNLVTEISEAVNAGERDVRIHLDCQGGTFGAAVQCPDDLKGLQKRVPDLKLSTHNTGVVAASGMVVFPAGRRRVGSADSQFGFRRVTIRPPPGDHPAPAG